MTVSELAGSLGVYRKLTNDDTKTRASESEFRKPRVIIRTSSQRPAVFSVRFPDREIVDARVANAHQPIFVEFPVLVAISPEPIACVVMPLIREAYCYPRFMKRP
jgi:hypothetical protein